MPPAPSGAVTSYMPRRMPGTRVKSVDYTHKRRWRPWLDHDLAATPRTAGTGYRAPRSPVRNLYTELGRCIGRDIPLPQESLRQLPDLEPRAHAAPASQLRIPSLTPS